jgi:dipeptidyl aminopeptidase/acylaminoacyl peptidase
LRLTAALAEGAAPIACAADECVGQIFWNVWWSEDGREVVFLRPAGASGREPALYAWSPETGAVRTILHAPDDAYGDCELAAERLICLREAPLLPRHVASVDLHTGAVSVVGDVNPEFSQFRFGAIERIEWDAPPDEAHLGYARRVRGHIIYPPDFDPTRRYPVFIAPYSAAGFKRGDAGDEHPLLVYAANDIIVVNTEFPVSLRAATTGDAASNMRRYYDPERNFPHLTSRMLSTLGGLDAARDRAPIDASRVGIGGVSHGAFIPMFILQNQDRLTAVSLGGPGWTQSEYYLARLPWPADVDRAASMWPEDGKFWSRIDLADHVDAIEAPVLFHYADSEIVAGARLFRRMSDAHLPFDAYSFPGEEHFKWQPAHRLAIYNRNLDWFRFWLQDIEDPDPVKAEQYERWRQLRQLQCRNPRSLRNYCSEADIQTTPAR